MVTEHTTKNVNTHELACSDPILKGSEGIFLFRANMLETYLKNVDINGRVESCVQADSFLLIAIRLLSKL